MEVRDGRHVLEVVLPYGEDDAAEPQALAVEKQP